MNPDKLEEYKMQELVDKLNYYTKKYDEGKPEISDFEWDSMYFQLQDWENRTGIYLSDSPTQNIDYQIVNKLNKVEHNHPMLSLDKTKDITIADSFYNSHKCIVMAKMDGLTCSLRYLDGKLVSAETRGNGIIGEDILHNALQVKNIPKRIDYYEELIIDGEIICTYNDFKAFENEYKNPRNFASGSIRLLDSQESATRNLTFVAWDVIKGLDLENLSDKLKWLGDLNFTVVPKGNNFYTFLVQIEHIQNECNALGYPIDGIVIKYDNCKEYEIAGKTDHHFKGGLAYKFYDEEYETTLLDIEWSMGRTGVLTPVAIFEPIEIDGTEVSRASLHNISIIRELFEQIPRKGQKVWVYKANMIIPQISRVEKYLDNNDSLDFLNPPEVCPICGQPTQLSGNNDSIFLSCGNPQCQGKLINKLNNFCGKNGLDIKGLSTATLEKLIDWGGVSNYIDIYKLENYSNEWKNKAGFGEKSVERILSALELSKNTTLNKVIAAAGIPLIGPGVAKMLSEIYHTWIEFRNEKDFEHIDGIGPEMNNSLLNFNYTEIEQVIPYLNIENDKIEKKNKLENLTFCITGKVHTVKNRDELKAIIENNGGKVVGSMSSKVNYLINNDNTSTSAKNIAAKQAGIPIITEEELKLMI